MYAIIETGGKQYKVTNDEVIFVEKLDAEDNATVTFNVDGEKLVDKKFVIDVLPEKVTVYNDNELVDAILNA